MLSEIRHSVRPAISLLLLFTIVLGLIYPALITGVAQLTMPAKANGSLIRDGNIVVGSELIGQNFVGDGFFHPRLSAAGDGYDASASAASNLAPGSKDLADRISKSVKDYRKQGVTGALPADLVSTSASGLDPHISPEAAFVQVARVARAREMPEAELKTLIRDSTEQPLLGFVGEPRVNVLLLNRQVDKRSAKPAP